MSEQQRHSGEEPEETELIRASPESADEADEVGNQPEPDEDLIRAAWPNGDEPTQIVAGDDDATRVGGLQADGTQIMPPVDASPAWAGRAGVPEPEQYPPLRDSTAPRYQQSAPPPPAGGRTWWTPLLLGLLALGLVGIVVIAAWLMSRDSNDRPAASQTPAPATTAPPTPTASPTPATASASPPPAQLVQIPAELIGLSQDDATKRLGDLGLFWSFDYQASSKPANTVIATRPGPLELVPLGSTVTLVVAIDQPSSPSPSPSASTTAVGGG